MTERETLSPYYVDVGDADMLMLRREDDSLVAAFSAQSATHAEIWSTYRQDIAERSVRTSPGEVPGRAGQRRHPQHLGASRSAHPGPPETSER